MNYLLSASLAMVIFYALYWLAFRRLRFHALNRAYLLAALGASLVIPLVEVPVPAADRLQPVQRVFYANPVAFPEPTFVVAPAGPEPVDWASVVWYAYLTGVSVMALRLGRGLWRLARLLDQPGQRLGGLKVIPTTGPNASFFHWILLNETGLTDTERQQVLSHEAEHARLGHSADRLALAALRVAFWFNPVLWLYQRSLAHLHELEVDARLAHQFDARSYAHLLLKLHGSVALPLTNLFSRQPLKDRLVALSHPKPSSAMKKLLYVATVPVLCLTAWACGKSQPNGYVSVSTLVPADSIRIYDFKELGPNPLVIIDGKNYPSSVLTRIDPEKMIGVSTRSAQAENALQKYGPASKDGVLELFTKPGASTPWFDNDQAYQTTVENLRRERTIPPGQFFAKLMVFDRAEGAELEKIIFHVRKQGERAVSQVANWHRPGGPVR